MSIFSCACWPYVCLLWKIFPSILNALCPFYYCCFLKIFTFLQNISLKLSPSGRLGCVIRPAVLIITSSQSLAGYSVFFTSYLGCFLPSFKEKCIYGGGVCVCVRVRAHMYMYMYMCVHVHTCICTCTCGYYIISATS